jgi:hypothetical protein
MYVRTDVSAASDDRTFPQSTSNILLTYQHGANYIIGLSQNTYVLSNLSTRYGVWMRGFAVKNRPRNYYNPMGRVDTKRVRYGSLLKRRIWDVCSDFGNFRLSKT